MNDFEIDQSQKDKNDIKNIKNEIDVLSEGVNNIETQVSQNIQQIIDIKTSNENNAVANTLRKLKQGQKIKVGLLGDSLIDGAGGTPYWYKLLFDEEQRNSGHSLLADFNLPASYIQYDNYAIGGTTPDLMLAHVIPQAISRKGDFGGGQVSEPIYTNPPALAKCYDLVFIDGGYNGGLYTGLMIEEIVRRFIEVGTEVVLISSQNGQWLTTPPSYQSSYKTITRHYGCKLIDFHELYSVNRSYADTHYYYDSIHQSVEGHIFWADTIRGFLNTDMATKVGKSTTGLLPTTRIFYFTEDNRLAQSNYSCYFVNLPSEKTGVLENAITGDGIKNPLVSQVLTQHTKLSTGQYAQFGLDDAVFVIPVWGGEGNTATVDTYLNGASTINYSQTIKPGNSGYTTAWTKNDKTFDTVRSVKANYSTDRTIKFSISSGSLKLLGLIVFSEPNLRLKNNGDTLPKGVSNIGTWTRLANWLGKTDVFYTNTLNDNTKVDFIGSAISVMFGYNKAGGKVEVSIDGNIIETIDTYVNADLAFRTIKYNATGYGKHTLQLKYISTNASAVSPVGGEYPWSRLVYKEFQVIDGRQNQTERYSLIKKWSESIY